MSTTTTNTVYLVRHGENTANITKEFSYKHVDYSLTHPKGEEQARQTALFFQDIPLDAVYSSPLKRARETAEYIARSHNLSVGLLEEFREVNIGDLEIASPPADILLKNWQIHDETIRSWIKGNHTLTFPGGENYLELLDRSRRGLLAATHGRDHQRILISSHGGLLSAIVRAFCPNASSLAYGDMGNCAITEIELTTSDNEVTGDLRSWACTTHLSGDAANQVSPRPLDAKIPM